MSCQHADTEPVEVHLDHIARALGDTTSVEVVARICTTCGERLPVNWGCPGCEWIEVRQLGDRYPTLLPGLPCPIHRE